MSKRRLITLAVLALSGVLIYSYVNLSFAYYEVTPFNVEISASETELSLNQGEQKEIFVTLKNNSRERLSVEDNYFLSYHVYNTDGAVVLFDNDRTPFEALGPKGTVRDVPLTIKPMQEKGIYIYKLDIVQEGVTWYSENNNPTFDIQVNVK